MREVDRHAITLGLTLERMMENAGAALAWMSCAMLNGNVAGRRITVLAGSGGNGGGGLVAARRLAGWGAEVDVRLASQRHDLAPVTAEQLTLLDATSAHVRWGAEELIRPDLFIDAILGYGQRGEPRATAADLIAAAGELIYTTGGTRVLSLDVPSGLELAHGTVGSQAVAADATLTLALPKVGLRSKAAEGLVGTVYLADISIPPMVYKRIGIPYRSPFSGGPIVGLV